MNSIPDSIVLVLRTGLGQRAHRLGLSICDYLEQGSPASLRLSCALLTQIGAVTTLLGGRRIGAFCVELDRYLKHFDKHLDEPVREAGALLLCQGVARICGYCESFTAPGEDSLFAVSMLDELRQARGRKALRMSGVDEAADTHMAASIRQPMVSAALLSIHTCVVGKLQKITGLMNTSTSSFHEGNPGRDSIRESISEVCPEDQAVLLRELMELASVLQVLGIVEPEARVSQLARTWQIPAHYLGIALRLGRPQRRGCPGSAESALSIKVTDARQLLRADAECSLLRLLSLRVERTATSLQEADAGVGSVLRLLRRIYLLGVMLPRGEQYAYWMQQLALCLLLSRHLDCWSPIGSAEKDGMGLLTLALLRFSEHCKEFAKALLSGDSHSRANAMADMAKQKRLLRQDRIAARQVLETYYSHQKGHLTSVCGAHAALQTCFLAELENALPAITVNVVPNNTAGAFQVSDGLISIIDLLAANTHAVGCWGLHERIYELRCLLSDVVEKQIDVADHLPGVLQALRAVLQVMLRPVGYASAEFYGALRLLDTSLLEWAPLVQVRGETGREEARLSMRSEAGQGEEIVTAKQLPVYLASNLRVLLHAPAVLADPVVLKRSFRHLNRKWLVELRMLTAGARVLRVHRIAAISAVLGDLHQSFCMAQELPASLLSLLLEAYQVLRRSLNQAAAWQEVTYAGDLVNALYHALEKQSAVAYGVACMSGKGFSGFRAEAEELMEKIQTVFEGSTWRTEPEPRQTLLSCLHTLKGNARLFACDTLASICHRCESFLLALPALSCEAFAAVAEAPNVLNDEGAASAGIEVLSQCVEELRAAVDHLSDDERCSVAEGLPLQPIPQENSIAVPMESLQKTAGLAARLHNGISALADIVATLGEGQEVAGLTTALELLREQRHCVTQLEEEIAGARRVSFARLVPRLQRLSARHSSLLDKQVRLLVHDVDLCAERSLVERLVAPLEHLLRNAIDHGIETPAQRRSCGKAEIGTVEIHMQEAAGALCVSMRDDGAGIDARLLPQGLDSVFLPGLSTKPHANADAGHGLGLAAVKATIVSLGGSVALSSVVGQGSCFTLRLPVSGEL